MGYHWIVGQIAFFLCKLNNPYMNIHKIHQC